MVLDETFLALPDSALSRVKLNLELLSKVSWIEKIDLLSILEAWEGDSGVPGSGLPKPVKAKVHRRQFPAHSARDLVVIISLEPPAQNFCFREITGAAT